jgi:putative DNA primase/helicase
MITEIDTDNDAADASFLNELFKREPETTTEPTTEDEIFNLFVTPPPLPKEPTIEEKAFATKADALANKVMTEWIVTTNRHGYYWLSDGTNPKYPKGWTVSTAKDPLTAEKLISHFKHKDYPNTFGSPRHRVGILMQGRINDAWQSKGVCIESDNHGDDTPENRAEALIRAFKICDNIRKLGIRPLLEESNGKGGCHIWVFFRTLIPLATARAFGQAMIADVDPSTEVFPKQSTLPIDGVGNWVRLPGKHYKSEAVSSFYDFDAAKWLTAAHGVDMMLAYALQDPALIPTVEDQFDEKPKAESTNKANHVNKTEKAIWLEDWAKRHKVIIDRKGKATNEDGVSFEKYWVTCPFVHASGVYKPNDSYILVYPNGYGYHCSHTSCSDETWKDFRAKIEPALKAKTKAVLSSAIDPKGTDGLIVTDWDTVSEEIFWLWLNRIPMGNLTLIAGEGGKGKSTAAVDFAAVVSVGGTFPNGDRAPLGDAIIFSGEDGDNVVKKRLRQQGADLSRVHKIDGQRTNGDETYFDIGDLDTLEKAIARWPETKLIIIDPIASFVSGIDSHKTADVRRVLTPLQRFAEKHNLAVIMVMHLNKDEKKSMSNRISGSLAWRDLSRAVHFVVSDKEEADKRYLFHDKNNYGPLLPACTYTISDGIVKWTGETSKRIEDVTRVDSVESKTKKDVCVEWLSQKLSDCGETAVSVLESEGAKMGLSTYALRAARESLKLKSRRPVFGGEYFWNLPDAIV